MIKETIKMVSESVNSFVNRDLSLANAVIQADDIVDELFLNVKDEIVAFIKSDVIDGKQALDLIMIAKYFEKISDHSVNIAKWAIFTITGEHNHK